MLLPLRRWGKTGFVCNHYRKLFPVAQVGKDQKDAEANGMQVYIENGREFYNAQAKIKVAEGYKDLHKITFESL